MCARVCEGERRVCVGESERGSEECAREGETERG